MRSIAALGPLRRPGEGQPEAEFRLDEFDAEKRQHRLPDRDEHFTLGDSLHRGIG
jgi:hypothetical protein